MNDTIAERVAAVFEKAKHETLALLAEAAVAASAKAEPTPEWMTDAELARHWRIFNGDGEPVTAGIRSWTKRPPDEHPLPHAYMGDLLRFRRVDVDRWADEEVERRKAAANRKMFRAAS